ncbi:Piso0_001358 [Millerozyma farinosa CBS 7064]|uniref:Piso0_001358 protein n=1 Tax=Pichia sorbitophila (strain ATCC MYA-4447 / BCRC 22081 / CBS 7064 / NBRC 10061 / NRRL Y-12695) TaxID=559304 RepID=G8YMJ3_PICSO|nr:Piso0_001358 [Millerozyma farinosa CBS 7064]
MSLPLTLQNVILTIKEALVVWINQILYYNEIYPAELYEKRRSFERIVFISRNPILNRYIEDFLDELFRLIIGTHNGRSNGNISKVIMVTYDVNTNETRERYVIELKNLLNLRDQLPDLSFLQTKKDDPKHKDDIVLDIPGLNWSMIYSQLNSFLFEHITELKRKVNISSADKSTWFYKLFVEAEASSNLLNASENSGSSPINWAQIKVRPPKEESKKPISYMPVSEVDAVFVLLVTYNEYL